MSTIPDGQRSILVVVPTLNEVRTIERVVIDLCDGPLPPNATLTLVVADGGSSDGTVNVVHRLMRDRPQLRLIHNPDRIQSAGVNLAARVADGQQWRTPGLTKEDPDGVDRLFGVG